MDIGNQFHTNIYQYIQFLKGKRSSLGSMFTKNVELFDWASFKTTSRCPPFHTCPLSELSHKSGAMSLEITPLYKNTL